jgi:hypothetical protein
MLSNVSEKVLAKVLAIGSSFTTIFLVSDSVTDPVNVTKLVSLGVAAFVALGIVIACGLRDAIKTSKAIWILSGIFLSASAMSIFFSDSPISQGIYGSYGRNNGFLAYVFFIMLLIATTNLTRLTSLNWIVIALLIAGIINVVYSIWVIAFGDFIGWNNPYGNILGTLGNPNFVGSFLGIFLASYLAIGLGKNSPQWFKYSILVVIPTTAFAIFDSSAIQGRVVGVAGIGIVIFFFVRSRFKPLFTWLYLVAAGVVGAFATLGALQIGPLTSFIYKTSVSLRGQYWLAGWNTGETQPLTGVGMDGFGDWYRRARDIRAIELPGTNTVVNAAHNVPLDMFAFGGWPLFISYLLIFGLGGLSLVKAIARSREYEPVLVAITVAWVGYQLQSIISINQIGLAIWGWVLTGTAIAYERITRLGSGEDAPSTKVRRRNNEVDQQSKVVLTGAGFGLVGLLIALPPLTADAKWRGAQVKQSVEALEGSMVPSYFNPPNSMKYMTNIQILEQSNLPDLAHKYALEAVAWNPEAFELWKTLYLIRNSSAQEKELALVNMKRLDPLNPDVTSIK